MRLLALLHSLCVLARPAVAVEVSTAALPSPTTAAFAVTISSWLTTTSAPTVAFSTPTSPAEEPPETAPTGEIQKPVLRGVHISGWGAGSQGKRRQIIAGMRGAGLDMAVIALKEYEGEVFVPGVPLARASGAYQPAMPDLAAVVKDFHDAGIYAVGRVVLFKDDHLARHKPEWAVRRPNGQLWTTYKGKAWVDPYRREVWDYNLDIASRAAVAGFDEIQFDYIRFPSDGPVSLCRYSRADHSKQTAAANLVDFLARASERLRPLGVKLSIAVFGLTTTDDTGMGIGQHISFMADKVDYVCPMMYPSHYHKGEYGIKDPNKDPYRTIHRGLRDVDRKSRGLAAKLRPYLQDFSLGHHYGPAEVRAQILAAARMGVTNWTLWNAANRYTWNGVPNGDIIQATAQAGPETEDLGAVTSR